MNKIAEGPADAGNGNMWQGILQSGLAGAGVGAAGMGLASALGPENKKRSLLKSMLMGGAMGGLTGAGARVGYNYFNPEAKNDPSNAISRILSPEKYEAPKPEQSDLRDGLSMLSTHDKLIPLGAGAATAGTHSYLRNGEGKQGPRIDRMFGGVDPQQRVDNLNEQILTHREKLDALNHQVKHQIGPVTPEQMHVTQEQIRQHTSAQDAAQKAVDEWNAKIQNSTAANVGHLGPFRSAVKKVNPAASGTAAAAATWLLGQLARRPLQEQTWYDKVNTPAQLQQMGIQPHQ